MVSGTLSVIDSTDWGGTEPAIGFPDSFSDFHDFAYSSCVIGAIRAKSAIRHRRSLTSGISSGLSCTSR